MMDKEIIINRINNEINRQKECKKAWETIKPILIRYEDKVLNKRLETFLKKNCKEYEFHFENKNNLIYLNVRRGFNLLLRLFLGYKTMNDTFTMRLIDEYCSWVLNIGNDVDKLTNSIYLVETLLKEKEEINKLQEKFNEKLESYGLKYFF